MNREEIMDIIVQEIGCESKNFSFVYNIVEFATNKIYDKVENEMLELQKENTRLKKQLANNHHIECSCSFCKPAGEINE